MAREFGSLSPAVRAQQGLGVGPHNEQWPMYQMYQQMWDAIENAPSGSNFQFNHPRVPPVDGREAAPEPWYGEPVFGSNPGDRIARLLAGVK